MTVKLNNNDEIKINDTASFVKIFNDAIQREEIQIIVNEKQIGSVNRGLLPTFLDWMNRERIIGAWIEKVNATSGKPAIYLYVKIAAASA